MASTSAIPSSSTSKMAGASESEAKRAARHRYGPPTLIIIMGTSGSGKSTLGSSLSQGLEIPFIDGDDLHPQANVDKMSSGRALDDADREPWLRKIRQRAWEVLSEEEKWEKEQEEVQERRDDEVEEEREKKRRLAEIYETSGHDTHPKEAEKIIESAEGADPDQASSSSQHAPQPQSTSTHPPFNALIVACSALKRTYRDLLRGQITSLPSGTGTSTGEPSEASSTLHMESLNHPLKVLHLYIHVSPQALLERMHARKGHFMKEEMLKSQLETLEEPVEGNEPGVVVVDGEGERGEVERRVEERMRAILSQARQ